MPPGRLDRILFFVAGVTVVEFIDLIIDAAGTAVVDSNFCRGRDYRWSCFSYSWERLLGILIFDAAGAAVLGSIFRHGSDCC